MLDCIFREYLRPPTLVSTFIWAKMTRALALSAPVSCSVECVEKKSLRWFWSQFLESLIYSVLHALYFDIVIVHYGFCFKKLFYRQWIFTLCYATRLPCLSSWDVIVLEDTFSDVHSLRWAHHRYVEDRLATYTHWRFRQCNQVLLLLKLFCCHSFVSIIAFGLSSKFRWHIWRCFWTIFWDRT